MQDFYPLGQGDNNSSATNLKANSSSNSPSGDLEVGGPLIDGLDLSGGQIKQFKKFMEAMTDSKFEEIGPEQLKKI